MTSSPTNEKSSKSSTKHPTPLELDRFVPWMFMDLQLSQTVAVRKLYQVEYPRKHAGRKTISPTSFKSKNAASQHNLSYKANAESALTTDTGSFSEENTIQLAVYYSRAGHVVQIAIDSPFPINRKLIETISLCLPFHNMLNKLTCNGKALDCNIIDEIAKMLPFSQLTDISLDNTFVPQGNYFILLDQASTLKYLSLSKCRINDVVCEKIAERLEFGSPASKTLLILCLSSNFITDIGALALGHALRTNRHILHLNLCGNSITSTGAGHLLEPLSEFLMTTDEVKEKIRRRWDYYKRKAAVAPQDESATESSTDLNKITDDNQQMRGSLKKKSQSYSIDTVINASGIIEKTAEDYAFGVSNTVFKNGCWYASGNLVLCSLNLRYNDLDFTSLPKILKVLSYQKDQERCKGCTGLMRIAIEGNNLPVDCEEYVKINMYLEILRTGALSFKNRREPSSTSRKGRRSTVHLRSPRNSNGDRNSPPVLSPVSAQKHFLLAKYFSPH